MPGGIIGVNNTPLASSAAGIWRPSYAAVRMDEYAWPVPDANFTSVRLLTHFFNDGLNGQFGAVQRITPAANGVWTAGTSTSGIGNYPLLSNAQAKWGSLSLSTTATGSRWPVIISSGNGSQTMGTGDFCIELWVYPRSLSNTPTLWDFRGTTSNVVRPALYFGTDGSLHLYVNGADACASSAGALVINSWQHVAIARVSGTTRAFVNGTSVASFTDSNNYSSESSLSLGANNNNSNVFECYLQDFRVTKGAGRYSSTFAVPTAPFPEYGP